MTELFESEKRGTASVRRLGAIELLDLDVRRIGERLSPELRGGAAATEPDRRPGAAGERGYMWQQPCRVQRDAFICGARKVAACRREFEVHEAATHTPVRRRGK